MVGLVLVSHSHRLAEGAAELARQMGGSEVRIETAAGLDTPEHEIGTDAVLVAGAIERVWSDDGVLVLMDLGSAVLSAEMALDLLPGSLDRDRIRLIEAPFVEGAVAAAVTARIGETLDGVAREARGALASKAAHLGVATEDGPPAPADASATGRVAEVELDVGIEHGLHARPAAAFVRAASAFAADVRVEDLTAGRGPVSARSLNALATLGVRQGDRIRVTATGEDADDAIEAIRGLAERSFDEAPSAIAPVSAAADAGRPDGGGRPTDVAADGGLRGVAASPGVAVGPAVRFAAAPLTVPELASRGADVELDALDRAIEETAADIARQRATIAARSGAADAAIFDAHLLLLADEAIVEPARAATRGGAAAATAWHDAVDVIAARWDAIDDPYQRARAADVRSVGGQVLGRILGVGAPRPRLEHAGIVVAADLAPADAAALDPAVALGVGTAFGGATGHGVLIARSLAIPVVVGIGDALLEVADGTMLALDGDAGRVILDPDAEVVLAFEGRRREREEDLARARAEAHGPAVTQDGAEIEVAANIGSPADVASAVDAGCDGVGLFRSEFLYLDRPTLPDEDEQEAAYRAAAEALGGLPLTIRTLDVGADKPLPALPQPLESNPFLGVRGIRLALERPDLLETQLRAILRVAVDHPVRVMFPMIATVAELRAARSALERARTSLLERGLAPPERIEVGVMIEVPSAALVADRLAEDADYFSIGTNDLTQYALAAERGNGRVAGLADPLDPAVLELIRRTCDGASAKGRWVGVCGEIAGDPVATPLLLGLGVRELSMSAPAIGSVKRAVRTTDLVAARTLAERALAETSAAAVRALVAEP